jgi:hypothetical protein
MYLDYHTYWNVVRRLAREADPEVAYIDRDIQDPQCLEWLQYNAEDILKHSKHWHVGFGPGSEGSWHEAQQRFALAAMAADIRFEIASLPTTMNTALDMARLAKNQLADYGYTMDDAGVIHKGSKALGVIVTAKGRRLQAKSASGQLLWSGPDVGVFVAKFWHARRK